MKRPPLYTFLERIGFRPWARTVYRISIEGAERVPKTGPVILIANHESLIDPWFLALVTPRPVRYMAKAELFGIAPLRWIMNAFGTFPVERGTGDLTAFTRGEQLLREGHVLARLQQPHGAGLEVDVGRVSGRIVGVGRCLGRIVRQILDEAGEHRRGLLAVQLGIVVLIEHPELDDRRRHPRHAAELAGAIGAVDVQHFGGRHAHLQRAVGRLTLTPQAE